MNVGPFTIKVINGDGTTRSVQPEEEKEVQRQIDLVSDVAALTEYYGDDFFDP